MLHEEEIPMDVDVDGVLDDRSPETRLEEIELMLGEFALDMDERMTLLTRYKGLAYLAYGPHSLQALRAHLGLSALYNSRHESTNALRHLAIVERMRPYRVVKGEDEIMLAIQSTIAYLQSERRRGKESALAVSKAFAALKPISNAEIGNMELRFLRDLLKARIEAALGHWNLTFFEYETALETLDVMNRGKEVALKGHIYIEMAKTAQMAKDTEGEKEYYRKAFDVFMRIGMPKTANKLKQHVPKKHRDLMAVRLWLK
jgi:hypothetical protein